MHHSCLLTVRVQSLSHRQGHVRDFQPVERPPAPSQLSAPVWVNHPPEVLNQTYTISEDTVLRASAAIGLLRGASDVEGGALAVVNTTSPASGTLVAGRNGSFTYVPNPNFSGQDSFDYVVTDGDGGFSQGTSSITIGEPAASAGCPG